MIKLNENWKQPNGLYKCPHCGSEHVGKGICSHIWRTHGDGVSFVSIKKGTTTPRKGKTKNTDEFIKRQGETLSERYKKGEIKHWSKGKHLTSKHKKAISDGHNKSNKTRKWGAGNRTKNRPSYPEIFFMEIIKNNFKDTNYIKDMSMGIYYVDFAWPHKKKAIEIDGDQHIYCEKTRDRDRIKDKMLKDNGWELLRIRWKVLRTNADALAEVAKNFIGDEFDDKTAKKIIKRIKLDKVDKKNTIA